MIEVIQVGTLVQDLLDLGVKVSLDLLLGIGVVSNGFHQNFVPKSFNSGS